MHPQPESYWGDVNPIGPRSVYDEAKRFAESLTMAYRRTNGVATSIVRIFNTYGPRMRKDGGRAVPPFVEQALSGKALTVAGDGSQTRSLCYVDDLIDGLVRMAASGLSGPGNLGNPHEVSMLTLAREICDLAASRSSIAFVARPEDDPQVRQPDISLARDTLGSSPSVPREEGLRRTIAWFMESVQARVVAGCWDALHSDGAGLPCRTRRSPPPLQRGAAHRNRERQPVAGHRPDHRGQWRHVRWCDGVGERRPGHR